MKEWGEDKDTLVDLFGKVRDEWMDNDLTTWIGANRQLIFTVAYDMLSKYGTQKFILNYTNYFLAGAKLT